jgi:hypothetical protein
MSTATWANPTDNVATAKVSRRSAWSDNVWLFDAVRPGVPASSRRIDWDFALPGGSRFAEPRWTPLRNAAKSYLWSLKNDPAGRGPIQNSSLVTVFHRLRVLVRWMAENNIACFADLDEDAVERFIAMLRKRPGRRGVRLTDQTVYGYAQMIAILYRQRAKLPDAPHRDPLGLITPGVFVGKKWSKEQRFPHTPDAIAVALVKAALRLIGTPADDVITLRAAAQQAYDLAIAQGASSRTVYCRVCNVLARFAFSRLPDESSAWQEAIGGTLALRFLIARIYDACFVVVAYLVGARVSEILALRAGCIEYHASADGRESFAYLRGHIFKTGVGERGEPHRWVAPEPVVRAIKVLELLSEPLRRRTGRNELWLLAYRPASAILVAGVMQVIVPSSGQFIARLNNQFAPFVGLPAHQNERWWLTPHQGRKTFARFIGRKDRTGLHALQAHLGHVSRVMTDSGYVGTDFDLVELADAQAWQETRIALEELLTAPRLGGRAGKTIVARSPFRGRTRDGDLRTYVEFLIAESDMRLGVCDWGYCVYRRETSACLGGEKGPNPVLRSESTCANCPNFAISERHRPIWETRKRRNLQLLDAFALDPESAALARERVAECDRVLSGLDGKAMETDDAQQASHAASKASRKHGSPTAGEPRTDASGGCEVHHRQHAQP